MDELGKLLLVGFLGWLLGQATELLRLRREEHRAFGRALKTLLYIRSYLYSLKKTKELITEHFPLQSQQIVQFQYFMQTFLLPDAEKLLKNYDEAISVISGVKPLLGLSLAKKTELMPMIMRYLQLVGQNEQAASIWLSLETHISDPSVLDDIVLRVAELHSIETHDEVKGYLIDPILLPPDFVKLLKERAKPKAPNLL